MQRYKNSTWFMLVLVLMLIFSACGGSSSGSGSISGTISSEAFRKDKIKLVEDSIVRIFLLSEEKIPDIDGASWDEYKNEQIKITKSDFSLVVENQGKSKIEFLFQKHHDFKDDWVYIREYKYENSSYILKDTINYSPDNFGIVEADEALEKVLPSEIYVKAEENILFILDYFIYQSLLEKSSYTTSKPVPEHYIKRGLVVSFPGETAELMKLKHIFKQEHILNYKVGNMIEKKSTFLPRISVSRDRIKIYVEEGEELLNKNNNKRWSWDSKREYEFIFEEDGITFQRNKSIYQNGDRKIEKDKEHIKENNLEEIKKYLKEFQSVEIKKTEGTVIVTCPLGNICVELKEDNTTKSYIYQSELIDNNDVRAKKSKTLADEIKSKSLQNSLTEEFLKEEGFKRWI